VAYRGSKEHLAYINRWQKEHKTKIQVSFDNEKDKDILEKIMAQPSRTEYLRQLIRKDIEGCTKRSH